MSTTIVECTEPARVIETGDGGRVLLRPSDIFRSCSPSFVSLRSEGLVIIRLLFPDSFVYDGRRALTMFPSESRQSRFLVARTPSPSPPASSSFSL